MHVVRGKIQKGSLRILHVSFRDQLTDAKKKPTPTCSVFTISVRINIYNWNFADIIERIDKIEKFIPLQLLYLFSLLLNITFLVIVGSKFVRGPRPKRFRAQRLRRSRPHEKPKCDDKEGPSWRHATDDWRSRRRLAATWHLGGWPPAA